jgi:hypothetical protein
MAEKTVRRNLVLPLSLWKSIAKAAANAGKDRAEFIRRTMAAACEQKGVAVSVEAAPVRAVQSEEPRRTGPIRVCAGCFAGSPIDATHCGECGKILPEDAPDGPDEQEIEQERERLGYDPDEHYAKELRNGTTAAEAIENVRYWIDCYGREDLAAWQPPVESDDAASNTLAH